MGLSRFAVPAFATVLLSSLNLLGVIRWLPESLPPDRRAATGEQGQRTRILLNLPDAFQRPQFGPLLSIRFLFSLALTLFMANFALYAYYRLGLTDQATSYVMTYAGILLILVQVVGVGWLTARFPEKRILSSGLVVITLALLGLATVSNLVLLLIILAPLALAGGTLNTVINSLISKSVPSGEVGGALGMATSVESLTWVIAPVLGGALIDYAGGWSLGLVGGAITGSLIAYTRRRPYAQADLAPPSRPPKEQPPVRPARPRRDSTERTPSTKL
jgi:MFS family permease